MREGANGSCKIEIATQKDAEEIARIQHNGWLATYPNADKAITEKDIKEKLGSLEKRIEGWMELLEESAENRTFIVRLEDAIVGFCKVEKREIENRLNCMYIDAAYTGRGFGFAVLTEALNWLGNDKPVMLGVVSYNKAAIEFYSRFGFVRAAPGKPHQVVEGKMLPMIIMRRPAL